jgi:hypothetical protein
MMILSMDLGKFSSVCCVYYTRARWRSPAIGSIVASGLSRKPCRSAA